MVQKKNVWVPLSIRREISIKSKGSCSLCKKSATYSSIDRRKIPKFYDENKKPFELDHIKELRKGGATTQKNLRLVCGTCNRIRPRLNKKLVDDVLEVTRNFKPI